MSPEGAIKKAGNKNCDLVRTVIERKMAGIKDMDFGVGQIAPIGLGLGHLENRVRLGSSVPFRIRHTLVPLLST
jgi:hypothetical protein